jgi:putative ABC transport system permease protein
MGVRSLRVALFLAGRTLARGNVGVSALTVMALLFIYVDLLFVPSLIQGAVDKVNEQLVDTLTSDLQITPAHGSRDIGGVAEYLAQIRATDDVAAATATYRVGTEISHGDESNVWSVDAIDPASYGQVFKTPERLAEGAFSDEPTAGSIVLGIQIAGADDQRLRGYATSLKTVHAGDTVAVMLLSARAETLTVTGIFNDQFLFADQKAYVPQRWAETVLPTIHDRATAIFVRTDGPASRELIARLRALRSDVNLHTPDEIGGAIKDEVATFKLINDILRVITLAVALIAVFIVTYVDLSNRRRQIGIERAIGIKPAAVIVSYVLKAVLYATVGIGLGAIAFVQVAAPLVERRPFEFPFGPATLGIRAEEMWRNALILVVVAAVSAAIPAWRAMRMRILDAIWSA